MATLLDIEKAKANFDKLEARMAIAQLQYEAAYANPEVSEAQEKKFRAKYMRADKLATEARIVWDNMRKGRAKDMGYYM